MNSTTQQQQIEVFQKLWRELSAVEAAYTTQRIVFYEPLSGAELRDERGSIYKYAGQQVAFHKAERATVRLVLGSNRSSKSTVGVVEAIAHSLGYRPWLAPGHPDRTVHLSNGEPIPVPNIGRIVAQDFQTAIKQTIFPKIQEWAPLGWYSVRRDARGIPVEIIWKNGSRIHLMSNDQDDMKFEGTSGHWVWADEPIDYKKYIGLKRGLIDYSGHMWMTMTPLTQPWIHDIIVNRSNDPDGQVKVFKFSIWDNCTEYGGYLRRVDIEEFLSDLREDELEARLYGNFIHLAGRVYKSWNPEKPYWIDPFDIPETWPRVCIVDPHPRKPVAVVWFAVNPDNQIYIYRDLFDSRLRTIKDVANKIKELEGWRYSEKTRSWVRGEKAEVVTFRIIDDSSKEQERTSGDNVWNRFSSEGLWHQLAKKRNAAAGYDAIHEAFKLRYEWSEPSLIIFNTCAHVKQNLLNFCWDDWASNKQRELKGPKQEVRKNHDDHIDCIRYYFQAGLTYALMKSATKRTYQSDGQEEDHFGRNIMSGLSGPLTRRQRQDRFGMGSRNSGWRGMHRSLSKTK